MEAGTAGVTPRPLSLPGSEKEAVKKEWQLGLENFSYVKEEAKGRDDDKIAAAVNLSRPTYRRAKAVVEAAEAAPENYAVPRKALYYLPLRRQKEGHKAPSGTL